MEWLPGSVKYAGSDTRATAAARGVIGVVAGRAEIYCLKCALGQELCVVAEVFRDTLQCIDARCDTCHAPLLEP